LSSKDSENPEFYISGILNRDISVLSRAITLLESEEVTRQKLGSEILNGITGHTGNSFRMAVSGVPGAGKSTLIENFGLMLLENGKRVAVLAIDPSSAITKGSILGDKTRMARLAAHKDVFIRPSPSGGSLGGVARHTYEAMLLCEAAGFDFLIIETVGVGQSEVLAANMTDIFVVLALAGAGDDLQGMKRGIMEFADMVLVNKADGENTAKARAAAIDYQRALEILGGNREWKPKAMSCSALTGEGLKEFLDTIQDYIRFMSEENRLVEMRQEQKKYLFEAALIEELKGAFFSEKWTSEEIMKIREKGVEKPFERARELVARFRRIR
jgi:LAO/AO transport system kinase